ncbi:DUF6227 family protein [Streptomyces sp. M19]
MGQGHSLAGGSTPAEHIDGLFARAENGFEIDVATVARLRDSLMHHSELRSCRQCNEPPGPAATAPTGTSSCCPTAAPACCGSWSTPPSPAARRGTSCTWTRRR